MPQYLREVLAANEYTTARDMAIAADRVWDLRQSAPTAAVAAASQPRERSASPHQRSRNSEPRPQLRPRPLTEPAPRPSPDTSHTGIPR